MGLLRDKDVIQVYVYIILYDVCMVTSGWVGKVFEWDLCTGYVHNATAAYSSFSTGGWFL